MSTLKIQSPLIAKGRAKVAFLALLCSSLLLFAEQSFCAQRDFFAGNAPYKAESPPIKDDALTFEQLGLSSSIKLQGNLAHSSFGFGSRLDELVTAARIDVIYTYSPSLANEISQVRVLLNNEIAGYLPVEHSKAGTPVKHTVNFDPLFMANYNEVTFELIAFREMRCATKAQASMWLDISNKSQVVLRAQPLPLKNDFSFFPKPFFDMNDFLSVEVPFVFPEHAQEETLEAAGIAASYLGSLAKWRGITFPVYVNSLPKKHGIVFATNDKRPDFLKDLPRVNAPTIQLITHPQNAFVKLLLVLGRDKQDLRKAMEGLSNGSAVLAGSFAEITQVKDILPREPYDAPNWIPTNREVKLGELVDSPTQLQAQGRTPRQILVNFNIPPDLFMWRSRGFPLKVKYRYSPPDKEDDSQLSVLVNDLFVEGFHLSEKGINEGSDRGSFRIPVVDDLIFGVENQVLVPGSWLSGKNKLQFEYAFTKPDSGDCRDLTANYMFGEIDADSTIDLTGFPHYLAMPDLKAFANVGFPFTRLADLADTAIIIDKNASVSELEAYLDVLGSFGASTGLPATKFIVVDSAPFDGIEDKDILVIGYMAANIMQEADRNKLFNVMVSKVKKSINKPIRQTDYITLFQPGQIKLGREAFKQIEFNNEGDIGALIGFESPWRENRSVVALVASKPSMFKKITSSLSKNSNDILGTVSLFKGDVINSFQIGETYYVGHLPIIKLIWFELSDRPILLRSLALLTIVLLLLVLWKLVKYIVRLRLRRNDGQAL
ncbi:MAG: cellulose biosynthesis cyclic di-GMP-binding regulatory protein BcsB [Methylobacter sp.]|jgi:hypothetical protein|nr:cellulose biosynthesis cyclic di-GMP-binding regulatory protein BcsB [Methylobacter sp.]